MEGIQGVQPGMLRPGMLRNVNGQWRPPIHPPLLGCALGM